MFLKLTFIVYINNLISKNAILTLCTIAFQHFMEHRTFSVDIIVCFLSQSLFYTEFSHFIAHFCDSLILLELGGKD